MSGIEKIRRKIDSGRSLQSVVRTMKTLSSLNIRQYEKTVEALAEYNRAVELGLQAILRTSFEPPVRESEHTGIIVFGSDQGMCGSFNEQIGRFAIEQIRSLPVPPEKTSIIVVGVRLMHLLEEAGLLAEDILFLPPSTAGIPELVRSLLLRIDSWQNKSPPRVYLIHNRYDMRTSAVPEIRRILPLEGEWLDRIRGRKWPTNNLPLHTMDTAPLFASLIRQYLSGAIHGACAQTMAGENASRLASMQAAEKNIEEHIAELEQRYRHERQSAITGELLDIISGFEAMREKENKKNKAGERNERNAGSVRRTPKTP